MKTLVSAFRARCLLGSLLLGPLFLCVAAPTQRSSGAPAQAMPTTAYQLIAVKVTGSKRFTREEVALASGLPIGTIAHEEDFKKAARQLGESGAFSDVAFTYSYSAAGTKLEFRVTDADKFVPARFADFVWFTDEELRQKVHERVPLFKGELPATGRLPEQVSDVLQAMLVENAVPGHVEYVRTSAKGEQLESIDYGVSGVSIRIRQVEFSGAGASELPLFQAAAEKLSDREYSRVFMNSFVERVLLPIYHEHGYLKASCAPPQPKVVQPAASDPNDTRTTPTLDDV